MKSIGIDAIDIDRFKHWHLYKQKQLLKIFTEQEIAYCLENHTKTAERFAARFAAKEACYKALSIFAIQHFSFIRFAKLIATEKNLLNALPVIALDSEILAMVAIPPLSISLSITHTKNIAIALVMLF